MGGGHVSLAAKNKNNDERVEKCKTYTQKKLWGRALKNIASRPSRRPSGQRHAFSTTHPNREMLGTGHRTVRFRTVRCHPHFTLKYFDEGCTAQTQGTELQTMLNVLEMNLNEHVLSVEEQR